jgi:hypothetical protein
MTHRQGDEGPEEGVGSHHNGSGSGEKEKKKKEKKKEKEKEKEKEKRRRNEADDVHFYPIPTWYQGRGAAAEWVVLLFSP